MELSHDQIKELEAVLLARRKALNAEVNEHLQQTSAQRLEGSENTVGDVGDESVAHMMTDLSLAEATRDINELRDVEAALQRIAEGGYGECLDCGGDIDHARLMAYPTATRCVTCQSQHEKTYATQGMPSL